MYFPLVIVNIFENMKKKTFEIRDSFPFSLSLKISFYVFVFECIKSGRNSFFFSLILYINSINCQCSVGANKKKFPVHFIS